MVLKSTFLYFYYFIIPDHNEYCSTLISCEEGIEPDSTMNESADFNSVTSDIENNLNNVSVITASMNKKNPYIQNDSQNQYIGDNMNNNNGEDLSCVKNVDFNQSDNNNASVNIEPNPLNGNCEPANNNAQNAEGNKIDLIHLRE